MAKWLTNKLYEWVDVLGVILLVLLALSAIFFLSAIALTLFLKVVSNG